MKLPRFGLGCARLTPRSSHLVRLGFELGIRHFDTAPCYGHGHSETTLAQALGKDRPQVTITTKAGLSYRHPTLAGRIVRRITPRPPQRHFDFSEAALSQSLHASLRALRTDYIDAFMLHMATPEDVTDDTISLLERFKAEGKIRMTGLASSRADGREILKRFPEIFDILQHDWCAYDPPLSKDIYTVTHGALRHGRSHQASARTLLAAAAVENETGTLLFYSRSPKRLRENISALNDPESLAMGRAFLTALRRSAA